MHQEDTIRAARAGKPILCEKPMSVSVEAGRTMIRACREAGVQLAVGYRCQFDPHHTACMQIAPNQQHGTHRRRVRFSLWRLPLGRSPKMAIRTGISGWRCFNGRRH
ncbi:MAG: Gfo/Idh/MocA family oxidoreductase [Planctomycetaceae bacterium]|nr:Gfo/Idh/MocA family oxidoreductase [Planctomycetaceae bacterium]